MALVNAKPRSFTVEEYALMGEAGVFHPGERLELIEGEVILMSPQNVPHASRIAKLNTRFVLAFGQTHEVRVQLPLTLGEKSEPEPDFAIVSFEDAERARRHPSRADLVVEIAESSLSFDRAEKASLYARAGIEEYWLLNLVHQRLEVRTHPGTDLEAIFGWSYRGLTILAPGQEAAPGFQSETRFSVSELLGETHR
ncbi:Uma2 family endonuclease [bacterium CPR1]|nr:Uma2 family endonuclease [bacterium CPR1]